MYKKSRHSLRLAGLMFTAVMCTLAIFWSNTSPSSIFKGQVVSVQPNQAMAGIIVEPGTQVAVTCPASSNQSPILGSEGFEGPNDIKVAVQRSKIEGVSDTLYFLSESYLLARPEYRSINTLTVFEVEKEYVIIADRLVGFRCGQGIYLLSEVNKGAAPSQVVKGLATVRTGAVDTSGLRKRGETSVHGAATKKKTMVRCEDLPVSLMPAPDQFFDWLGMQEKWLRDESKNWYFIERDGSLNALEEDKTSGKFIARVDLAYYKNIRLFAGCLNPQDIEIASDPIEVEDDSSAAFISVGGGSQSDAFALIYPEAIGPFGSVAQSEIRFEWMPVDNAVKYEVSLLSKAGLQTQTTPETFLSLPADWVIDPSAQYTWTVRAYNDAGLKTKQSDPLSFDIASEQSDEITHSAAGSSSSTPVSNGRIRYKDAGSVAGETVIEYFVDDLSDDDLVQIDLYREENFPLSPELSKLAKELPDGALRFHYSKARMEFSDPIRQAGSVSFKWNSLRFGDITLLKIRLLEAKDSGEFMQADELTLDGALCGDGIVSSDEACDDANTEGGDYCNEDCSLKIGYCGDGILQSSMMELCDDGNDENEDGCSSSCTFDDFTCDALLCESPRQATVELNVEPGKNRTTIEPGFIPYYIGSTTELRMRFTIESGNGASEEVVVVADTPSGGDVYRNELSGADVIFSVECSESDGTLRTCRLITLVENPSTFSSEQTDATFGIEAEDGENIFVSSVELEMSGCSCLTPLCGDGKKDWYEQCDDGNTRSGDNCSPVCTEN